MINLINTFCILLLASSLFVVLSANPIFSVFFLILAFINGAALTFISGHDYIAMLFIVLYVGAMCTFFLFSLMILDIKAIKQHNFNYNYSAYLNNNLLFLASFIIGSGYALATNENFKLSNHFKQFSLMNTALDFKLNINNFETNFVELNRLIDSTTQIYNIGSVIYTIHSVILIGAACVLLVALLGSIALTLNQNSFGKNQTIFSQNLRDFKKTIVKFK